MLEINLDCAIGKPMDLVLVTWLKKTEKQFRVE